MSDIVSTEPLHGRIAGLVKHLKGEYPPHVLADVSEAATLIEEQAARIEELEQKLRTTSLEALAISDTNNEMAIRIAEAEKDYHEERKARYAAQSELVASQARLSEAVKVLEEAEEWRKNVEAMLSTGDNDVIRCHEGGGPEDMVGSLVLTVMRTRNSRDKAVKVVEELHKGLDRVHNGLMDPTRPRQSVGEVCNHFLSKARNFLTSLGKEDKQ